MDNGIKSVFLYVFSDLELKTRLCKQMIYFQRFPYIRILGRKKVENISSFNIQTATNQLIEEEYGYRSIREALSVLSSCFETAIMNRMIQINPCKDIYIQQADIAPKEKRVLEKWKQDLFLKLTENDIYHDLYLFMLFDRYQNR